MMKRNTALFSSKYPNYITPRKLYQDLDNEFHFTLDPCTNSDNPLGAPKFFTEKEDGLKQSWKDERVYCNPPYHSRNIIKWIEKARDSGASLVVMLLPARTDVKWFHDYLYNKQEIRFLRGRLKFEGGQSSAPFPSLIAIWRA